MKQLSMFETNHLPLDKVVNVASVPLRSPFRYPGGKTWLVPRLRHWLTGLPDRPSEFIEPFAGGGIVGLTVAFEELARHVTMVELDEQVAAVWHTIINDEGGAEWLVEQIMTFDLTAESVRHVVSDDAPTRRMKAFQTIVKNRVYRGGILAPGAAPVRKGEDGKGLRSRWYPRTLRKRILAIAAIRERITFIEGDAFDVIERNIHRADVAFFFDPPYTAGGKNAGKRLYACHTVDHARLFALAGQSAANFLMTYDVADEIRSLAQAQGLDTEVVAMTNTHHATMRELLIGRHLDWLRS